MSTVLSNSIIRHHNMKDLCGVRVERYNHTKGSSTPGKICQTTTEQGNRFYIWVR